MATSGALTIGVKAVPPMPPSELIEKQPPDISAGPSFLSRAFFEISPSSRASSSRPFLSQSRITGTTRPSGVSTAMPMWKYFFRISFSPDSSSEALNCGNAFSAATTALIWNTSGVIFRSLFSAPRLLAEGLQLGDVGILVLGDMGDHRPVAREVGAGDLLDPRQRHLLDLAELG